jgi:hypothetical protein
MPLARNFQALASKAPPSSTQLAMTQTCLQRSWSLSAKTDRFQRDDGKAAAAINVAMKW